MALPALRALRSAWPAARITLVGRWAPLLSGQGVADLLLPYPRDARDRRRFDRALGGEGADLAILLPNSFEAAFSAWRWRARRRLGFDSDARRPLLTHPMVLPEPRRHQVDEYAQLVEALGVGVETPQPTWTLAADAAAEREVDALLADAGLPSIPSDATASGERRDGPRIVGLHLGAAYGSSKLWPTASFAELAGRLEDGQLAPLLLGTAGDRDAEAAVAAAARRPPASLVGRDRLALLPRLLARLACLVSADTGVAHLAAALRVPTVTLFGPTDPRLTIPRGPAARAASNPVPCAPCFLAACPIEHPCLDGLEPEIVEREVRRVAA